MPRLVRWWVVLLGAALVGDRPVPSEAALVAHGAVWVLLWYPRHGCARNLAEQVLVDVGAQQDTALRRILPEGVHHLIEVILRTGVGQRLEAR
eukprot:4250037-Pyramimonas_sp.AAC.1